MSEPLIINNYFSKIVKHHKNNLKVFSSVDNFLYSANSKQKVLLISKIIDYYGIKDELLTKLFNDFFELHSIIDDFEYINILIERIFNLEISEFKEIDRIEIEENILKYKPIFIAMIENKYNRLINFIINSQSDASLLTTIRNIILNEDIVDVNNSQNIRNQDTNFNIIFSEEENEKILEVLNSDSSKNEAIKKLIQWKNKISFFNSMEDKEIALILKDVSFVSIKTNEVIIKENEDSKEIYFLLNGECKALIGRQIVGLIKEKSIFGEFSFISNLTRAATVIANENCVLIKFTIDINNFENKSYAYARLFKNIMYELVKKMETANSQLINRYKPIK